MTDYVRFGLFAVVLDNLWTCVTVLTAALSFRRIRAGAATAGASPATSRSSTADPQPRLHDGASSKGCPSVSDRKHHPSQWTDVSRLTTASRYPLVVVPGGYGTTKRRFTVYYDDDRASDEISQVEADLVAVVGAEEGGGGGVEWWSGWERVLTVRNGDTGWCRYQDLTVLDGSVVRLWHDKRGIR